MVGAAPRKDNMTFCASARQVMSRRRGESVKQSIDCRCFSRGRFWRRGRSCIRRRFACSGKALAACAKSTAGIATDGWATDWTRGERSRSSFWRRDPGRGMILPPGIFLNQPADGGDRFNGRQSRKISYLFGRFGSSPATRQMLWFHPERFLAMAPSAFAADLVRHPINRCSNAPPRTWTPSPLAPPRREISTGS